MKIKAITLFVLTLIGTSPVSSYAQSTRFIPQIMQKVAAPAGSGPGGISATSLAVWYRSDSLVCTGGCTGTNVVTTLTDKSGNANNCTTSGSPTYVASAVNSQPGILFASASSQFCTYTAVTWTGTVTAFAVLKCTGTSGNSTIFSTTSASSSFNWRACNSSNQDTSQQNNVGNIGASTTTASSTAYRQIGTTYDGTNWAMYIASTTDGSGTQARTITTSVNDIGNNHASEFAGYTLVEVFVYTRVLTGGEISTVQSYLHGRYGT